jgi:hypothetical protein
MIREQTATGNRQRIREQTSKGEKQGPKASRRTDRVAERGWFTRPDPRSRAPALCPSRLGGPVSPGIPPGSTGDSGPRSNVRLTRAGRLRPPLLHHRSRRSARSPRILRRPRATALAGFVADAPRRSGRAACPGCHPIRFALPARPARTRGTRRRLRRGVAGAKVRGACPGHARPPVGLVRGLGCDSRARARWVRLGKANLGSIVVLSKSFSFLLLRFATWRRSVPSQAGLGPNVQQKVTIR